MQINFIKEYASGKLRSEIFTENEFDINTIGLIHESVECCRVAYK